MIKAKYACYKEIFLKILSSFAEQAVQKITSWIDLFPKTYFLIYWFEWAEKPKWKCMAEDIYMRKLLKYFNGFPRTKSYFLTQFVQKNKINTSNLMVKIIEVIWPEAPDYNSASQCKKISANSTEIHRTKGNKWLDELKTTLLLRDSTLGNLKG